MVEPVRVRRLTALKSIRAARPDGAPIYVIMDNLSVHKGADIRRWAKKEAVTGHDIDTLWASRDRSVLYEPHAHLAYRYGELTKTRAPKLPPRPGTPLFAPA